MSLLYLEKYRNAKIVPFNYYCLLLLLHPSNSLLCRKTSLDLNEARDDAGVWDGSGICWTICKQSVPRSREITTPTPFFTGCMLFLMPSQLCQSTGGTFQITPFKCCVTGLPEFSQLLLDFFNIADLQLIFMMPRDFINLVL